ncbi:MAG TPA: hypothetical protein VN720_07345 [Rudaea sp.]|nr:hypothetical protein [Rudaea sp.]
MSERVLSVKQLRAVRMIRAGSASEQVCRALRLPLDSVRSLEASCRNVPDDILARLEQALSANEKLRRLVAGLGQPVAGMTGIESD